MNRYTQLALWILLALVFGTIQALASFSVAMITQRWDLGSHELWRLLGGLAFIYGGGWFIPVLVVSDLVMFRRTLSRYEFGRYVSLIALIALIIGLLMPGMMLMLGYPTTACAILLYGFLHRKRHTAAATQPTHGSAGRGKVETPPTAT